MEPEAITAIRETLAELQDDDETPRTVRDRLQEMRTTLDEPIALELRVDRMRGILEDLDENPGLPNYVRTQLWNLSALLEML